MAVCHTCFELNLLGRVWQPAAADCNGCLAHFKIYILCPFAVYYLRYAVRSFFTMSRISLADGKRAGQKVQHKIAVAVQKVKSSLLFIPLF
jgi:hypothetical protein